MEARQEPDTLLELVPRVSAILRARELSPEEKPLMRALVDNALAALRTPQASTSSVEALEHHVASCGINYMKAFRLISDAALDHGQRTLKVVLERYVNCVRQQLLCLPDGLRGHFGTLEANRLFAACLNQALDVANLRISTPDGPGRLNAENTRKGRPAGYWVLGRRNTCSELPPITLVARPARARPTRAARGPAPGRGSS